MTLGALTFTLTTDEAEPLGLAVLCPEAQYAAVQLAGVKRLIRRDVSSAQWREIERLIATGIETASMTAGVFHDVLAAGDPDKGVSYLHTMSIEAGDDDAVEALDEHLKSQPIELRLRLRQDD
jgi:hypothetical protein